MRVKTNVGVSSFRNWLTEPNNVSFISSENVKLMTAVAENSENTFVHEKKMCPLENANTEPQELYSYKSHFATLSGWQIGLHVNVLMWLLDHSKSFAKQWPTHQFEIKIETNRKSKA